MAKFPLNGSYAIIYADPPWDLDRGGSSESPSASHSGAASHYATMTTNEIAALPVERIAATDAVLLLWATSGLLPEALSVMGSWSFDYKQSMIWHKAGGIGLGRIVRVDHEYLLIGYRGSPCGVPSAARPRSVIMSAKGRHSAKPDGVPGMIDSMWPQGPRIELFARTIRPGWDHWGNESAMAQALL